MGIRPVGQLSDRSPRQDTGFGRPDLVPHLCQERSGRACRALGLPRVQIAAIDDCEDALPGYFLGRSSQAITAGRATRAEDETGSLELEQNLSQKSLGNPLSLGNLAYRHRSVFQSPLRQSNHCQAGIFGLRRDSHGSIPQTRAVNSSWAGSILGTATAPARPEPARRPADKRQSRVHNSESHRRMLAYRLREPTRPASSPLAAGMSCDWKNACRVRKAWLSHPVEKEQLRSHYLNYHVSYRVCQEQS